MKLIEQVKEFREKFNLPNATQPAMITPERQALHMSLILEEVRELEAAMLNGNLVGAADGIADAMYVLIGCACELGLADYMPAVIDEIQRSNLSKLGADGKPVYRSDGKVMKGPDYVKPDLKSIIFPDEKTVEE